MEFADVMLALSVMLTIAAVLYSWRDPLYLIPAFALLLGDVFGQVDLQTCLFVQVTEGIRIYLRDGLVIVMLVHVYRARHRLAGAGLTFYAPIVIFLCFILGNLVFKFMVYGGEFDAKVTPALRLFGTFAVYFLLLCYLTRDTWLGLKRASYALAFGSLVMLGLYLSGAIPLPVGFDPVAQFQIGYEAAAMRLGLPNAFFVLFPYFLAVAPLITPGERMQRGDWFLASAIVVGSFLSLYRMYFFIVAVGALLAVVARGGVLFRRLAAVAVGVILLVFLVKVLDDATQSGVVRAMVERYAGTEEELVSEGSSGGSRVFRTIAAIGALGDPGVFLLGTVFTKSDAELKDLFSTDLGVVASFMYYGIAGVIYVVWVYMRGLKASYRNLAIEGLPGRVAAMLFLFLLSAMPAVLLMYNPLEHERMICLWALVLGSFDALSSRESSVSVQAVA